MYWYLLLSLVAGSPQYLIDTNVVHLTPPPIIPQLQGGFTSFSIGNQYSAASEHNPLIGSSNIKHYNQVPNLINNNQIDEQYLNESSFINSNQNIIEFDLNPTKDSTIQTNIFSQRDYYSQFSGFGTSQIVNLPLQTSNLQFIQNSKTENNVVLVASNDSLTFLGIGSLPTETGDVVTTPTHPVFRGLEETQATSLPTSSAVSNVQPSQITSSINPPSPIILAPNITIVVIESDKNKNTTILSTTTVNKQYQSESTISLNWKLPWRTYF